MDQENRNIELNNCQENIINFEIVFYKILIGKFSTFLNQTFQSCSELEFYKMFLKNKAKKNEQEGHNFFVEKKKLDFLNDFFQSYKK